MALVPSFVQTAHQFSPTLAGLSAALFGLGGLLYASNTRRLLDRLGPGGLAIAGGWLFAMAMAVNWLTDPWIWGSPAGSTVDSTTGLQVGGSARGWQDSLVFVTPFVAGLGYYMLHNTLQVQASQLTGTGRGVTFSWFASSLWVGQGLGITAAALLAGRAGFLPVFIIAGVGIVALAAVFALGVRARSGQREDD